MKVRFSENAEADIAAVEPFIWADHPDRALTFARELAVSAIAIGDAPLAYPLLHRSPSAGLRRKVYKSYLIIYRVRVREVEIVRILHGSRDFSRVLASGEL